MNAQLQSAIMQIVNARKGIQKTAAGEPVEGSVTPPLDKVTVQNAVDAKKAGNAPQNPTAPTDKVDVHNAEEAKHAADVDKKSQADGVGTGPVGDQGIPENPSVERAGAALGAAGLGAAGYGIAQHFGGSESTKVLSTLGGMFGGGVLGHAMASYLIQHPDVIGGRPGKGTALTAGNGQAGAQLRR